MPIAPRVSTYDPLRAFKFFVTVTPGIEIGFQKVSGLKESSDVVEYREGNIAIIKRKLPGLTNFEPITLTKGATPRTDVNDLLKWRSQVAWFSGTHANSSSDGNVTGNFNNNTIGMSPNDWGPDGVAFRKKVIISVFDKGIDGDAAEGTSDAARTYEVQMAWPSELSVSDLNAEASEVLIETMVLQHEGFFIVS